MPSFRETRDYATLRKELLGTGTLFKDSDFPPSSRSLYVKGVYPRDVRVQWKRPKDISLSPKFTVGGASRLDLDQGTLGNCWFVAAVATLNITSKKLFRRVVPQDQSFDQDYAGIFHFMFWWYGSWVDIVVDDYLPTDGRRLIYCRNREEPDEFWPALLEKAYAKLRGCYENLDGGKINDGLVDLTGGISETLDLRKKDELPPNLFEVMFKTHSMESMIGGAILKPDNATESEIKLPNGLYQGHAYSITGFARVDYHGTVEDLLRVRNPWGKGEWNGRWSDRSPEMRSLSDDIKRRFGVVVRDDGEFWMEFSDFFHQFDEIEFCHLQPDALIQEIAEDTKQELWNVTVYHDAWIKGMTAGGCGNSPNERLYWNNPQFVVELTEIDDNSSKGECTLIISLLEKEKDNQSKIAMGYEVYKLRQPDTRPLDNERYTQNAMRLKRQSGAYQYSREVCCRFQLPPGMYVVIPATFHPHQESDFLLRIFTQKAARSGVLDLESGPVKPETPKRELVTELFDKHAGSDRKMDSRELLGFLTEMFRTELKYNTEFNLEACRCLLAMMDHDRTGFLSMDEVRSMWGEIKAYREVFLQFDRDNNGSVDTFELGNMFVKIGFPVSRNVLGSIVKRYGGRSNRISFEDFIMAVCKLVTMYNIYVNHRKNNGQTDVAQFTLNEWLQWTMFC